MAIYKCSWEVEPGTTRIKFNEWLERVLNPGYPDLKASAPTTEPHCLPCATNRARKLTKTLFIVTIVSLILVLPYNVVRIGFYVKLRSGEGLETIVHQIRRNFYLMESFLCLFLANSFINPLLYALKMPEFKRALFLLLRCRSHSEPV